MSASVQTNGGHSYSNTDLASEARSPEWWERYIPLLIPLLLVAVVLAYIWPTQPDFTPYFLGWMIITTASLLYVSIHVSNILKSSRYRTVTFKPDGTPITRQKRRFVGWAIYGSASLTLLVTLLCIFSTFAGDYALEGGLQLAGILTWSLIISTLFVLLWPGRWSRVEQWLDSRQGFSMAVLFGLLLLGLLYPLQSKIPVLLGQEGPAPWQTVLKFAQHQADRIGPGAVVESIEAQPAYGLDKPYSPHTTPFVIDFVFRRPNGTSSRISMLDTNPPRLSRVIAKWDGFDLGKSATLPADVLAVYASNLAYMKIGPRDAYRLTEQDGLRYVQKVAPGEQADVYVDTFLQDHDMECAAVPACWSVDYASPQAQSVNFRVDGATGRILELGSDNPPAKPSPTPTQ